MNCPRCYTPLEKVNCTEPSAQIEVDVCMKCEGIWFDEGELETLSKIVEPKVVEFRTLPPQEVQDAPIGCPVCDDGSFMKKLVHERDTHVVYDECEVCRGIWLDGGELKAIQQENWGKTLVRMGRWLIGK